jgi:hypothetical protein
MPVKRTMHGMTDSPTYVSWATMIDRCRNPHRENFKHYGGRGIKVCARWASSFQLFLADMGERPSLLHSIDRRDPDGDYEPGNCRWATKKEQANNRRSTVRYSGRTLGEWAEKTGLDAKVLWDRINRYGWEFERAISTPSRSLANPTPRSA